MTSIALINANATRIPLADNSVHLAVTSPPYWGLRDYNVNDQIGLESTPELYVEHMVQVFREVRRVLREDGTLWLNLGDTYNGSGGPGSQYDNRDKGVFKKYDNPNRKQEELKPKDLVGIPWRVAFALQADGWYLRSAPPWIKMNCMPESVQDRPTTAHEYWFLLSKSEGYYADPDAVRTAGKEWTGQAATFKRNGGKATELQAPGQSKPCHRPDRKQDQVGKRTYTGFNDRWAENPQPTRNWRTSDFFFESLDEAIAQERQYLAHLLEVRKHGGMLLDHDGDPLALVFNTKPYHGQHFATFNPDMIVPILQFSTSEGLLPALRQAVGTRDREGNAITSQGQRFWAAWRTWFIGKQSF